MKDSKSDAYAASGVDITAGYRAVELMKNHISRTLTPGVFSEIGGFGGLFRPDLSGLSEPVLVSGTDGVGTKLKLAFLLDRHSTVGIDCVAMCVNDIVCCGATPLFFLDYIACGRNLPERVAEIVRGVCDGCVEAGAALLGGETAEMPGFYPPDEYDLAGFAVGMVDRKKIIDPRAMSAGDVLLALPSSGLHSNGFSLVRRVFSVETADLTLPLPELSGRSLGEVLLTPTRIYVRPVLALLREISVRGISHITGGGFYENIPRCLPEGLSARMDRSAVRVPPIFTLLADKGGISDREMFNTFNMGVGMTLVVPKAQAQDALSLLASLGEEAYPIGEIVETPLNGPKILMSHPDASASHPDASASHPDASASHPDTSVSHPEGGK